MGFVKQDDWAHAVAGGVLWTWKRTSGSAATSMRKATVLPVPAER